MSYYEIANKLYSIAADTDPYNAYDYAELKNDEIDLLVNDLKKIKDSALFYALEMIIENA